MIQAMRFEAFFAQRMAADVDAWNRFHYFSVSVVNLAVLLTIYVGFVISLSAALFVALQPERFSDVAMTGIALNYTFVLPYFLSMLSLILGILLNGVTCLERLLEYAGAGVPEEAPRHLPSDPPPGAWPRCGSLELEGVSLRYREGLPLALRGVSCTFAAGERV